MGISSRLKLNPAPSILLHTPLQSRTWKSDFNTQLPKAWLCMNNSQPNTGTIESGPKKDLTVHPLPIGTNCNQLKE